MRACQLMGLPQWDAGSSGAKVRHAVLVVIVCQARVLGQALATGSRDSVRKVNRRQITPRQRSQSVISPLTAGILDTGRIARWGGESWQSILLHR